MLFCRFLLIGYRTKSIAKLRRLKDHELLEVVAVGHLTSQKNENFTIRRFQKNHVNLTIDLLFLGTYAPGSQVLT